MALINEVVADHFRPSRDLEGIAMDLDTGLYCAGLSVQMIRNVAVHGSPGRSNSNAPTEELAALADAVLCQLGQLGCLIENLEQHVRQRGHEAQQTSPILTGKAPVETIQNSGIQDGQISPHGPTHAEAA